MTNLLRHQLHEALDHILDTLIDEGQLRDTTTYEIQVQGYTETRLILGHTCEVDESGIQSECEVECDTFVNPD